ncbi:hypothetical protein ACMU_12060 [Actibacterium mucosum KCTC 23349]|uniref:Transcription factor LuxR-like autoinducer-binding domain-containing protein n=1 Tax=Actibacterium mucosum KCTC 23349 TaxID=1454373 RepID=A0A037ZIJ0_9RHOB|nr:autoinducer binding domain-containing protein [Actibacterium mucosum]KAJ55424.1 hypothetical protein ACMU_12060 [Actibacterium mucosum KCTC 23349]
MSKTAELSNLLATLSKHCDTGFALAIHIRFTRPSLLFQTYAPDWMQYYSQNGLFLSDPVVKWGIENAGLVHWDDLRDQDPAGVLAKASEHGLHNGITYSCGPVESRTISGLTTSAEPFTDAAIAEMKQTIDAVHALTQDIESLPAAEREAMMAIQLGEE